MDDRSWVVPTIIAVIVAISLVAVVSRLISERLQAGKDLIYKTREEHITLNSSSHAEWASGKLALGDVKELDRFSKVIAPVAQIVTVALLAITVILWNVNLTDANARLETRLSELELQLHAIEIMPGSSDAARTAYEASAAGSTMPVQGNGTPMQQACANLIGRVADAYANGQSSKIAQSLEELVNKLGCVKNTAP
jgi:hypothetical protein